MSNQPLIGPQVRYPTPWRPAEQNGNNRVIVDAEGSWVGEIPSDELADLIVHLVNREADPGMVNMLEANESLQELAGQLAEAHAEIERLTRMVEWQAWMKGAAGHDSYSDGRCECGDTFTDLVAWQWHRFSHA